MLIKSAVVAGAVVAAMCAAPALTATAAPQCSWTDYITTWPTDSSDPGGIQIIDKLYRTCDSGDYYSARFEPLGEHLHITDSYDDGRSARVYLEVEGNGTAVYTTGGDHNLSFDEGLDVRIKVCINGTDTCSAWSPKGRT